MATINHKKYDEATETFKDFYVYDGKETLIFKVDGEAGNVGIGTASPAAKVEIFGAGNTLRLDSAANGSKEILFRNVGSGTATIKTDGDLKLYVEDAGKNILFDTTGGEKMRITSAGLVGIGTSSPTTSLDVIGSGRFKSSFGDYLLTIENIKDDSQGLLVRASDNDSTPLVKFQSSVGATSETWIDRFVVNKDGNVGIGTSSPSDKLMVSGDIGLYNSVASGSETNKIVFRNGIYTIAQIKSIVGLGQINRGELAFDVDNGAGLGTAMYIDRSRNVGIGTASPDSNLHIKNTSGNAKVTIETVDAYDAYINFSGASGEWSMGYDRTSDDLIFCAADNITTNERVRFTSDGITFNGDTAAANALDDYEEGTWTPSASALTLNYTITTANGSYTKIGNQVTVTWEIEWTSANVGPAGTTYISNLPFTSKANSFSTAAIWIESNAAGQQFFVYNDPNSTNLYVAYHSGGASSANAPASIWDASNRFFGSLTYFV